jgi:hypothetical protein
MSGIRLIRFCIAMVLAAGASAQEFRATLRGRIVDGQGAVIVGAKVSVVRSASSAASEICRSAAAVVSEPKREK